MPELLACPECAGPLTNEGPRLRCGCSTWPVAGLDLNFTLLDLPPLYS